MREITDHKLNGLNEALKVIAIDRPGPGGANHKSIEEWKGRVRNRHLTLKEAA